MAEWAVIVLVGGFFLSSAIAGFLYEYASRSTMPGTSRFDVEASPAAYNLYKGVPSPEHFTERGIRAIGRARKVRRTYWVLAIASLLVLVAMKFLAMAGIALT